MNPNDPIEIIRAFVDKGPYWYWSGPSLFECQALCCETVTPDDVDMEDEGNHDDDCPWRLAREYLANLENPGYA